MSDDTLILILEYLMFADQPIQLNSSTGKQVFIPFCQSGQNGIICSQAAILLLKLLLLLMQAFQCRMKYSPFLLLYLVQQLLKSLALLIGQQSIMFSLTQDV
ncbi:MAG: hypothetical protein COW33_00095 [Anaerolineae bacterium CG17_big_fil_post_rev_8_21_14_2_50_57_27]|nr:MAG: hypothetical protein COW33_00095 [Anaerolineae bacterium CG17_big_fil_post_rev_8_21_14_2_50_57_27]PJH75251.1 MAG: hypothetical protein CO064_07655 [Anaerolineae bacterium CG_4_9_14_0_8_um_filter_58_9]